MISARRSRSTSAPHEPTGPWVIVCLVPPTATAPFLRSPSSPSALKLRGRPVFGRIAVIAQHGDAPLLQFLKQIWAVALAVKDHRESRRERIPVHPLLMLRSDRRVLLHPG